MQRVGGQGKQAGVGVNGKEGGGHHTMTLVVLSLTVVSLNYRKHYPVLSSLLDMMCTQFNYFGQEDQFHHRALCKGTWETHF